MKLFLSVLLPLTVGGIAGALTSDSVDVYKSLVLPNAAPPAGVFPVVWTVLYILMGIAAYLVWKSNADQTDKKCALILYLVQLAVNFIWPLLFFKLDHYLFAFIWLMALLVLIVLTIMAFSKISKLAARLMIPYLLWVLFASYLNLSVYLLNQ